MPWERNAPPPVNSRCDWPTLWLAVCEQLCSRPRRLISSGTLPSAQLPETACIFHSFTYLFLIRDASPQVPSGGLKPGGWTPSSRGRWNTSHRLWLIDWVGGARWRLVLDRIAALHVSDVAQPPDGRLQPWVLHVKPACCSRGAPQSAAQWQKQQVFNFMSRCSRAACTVSHQVKCLSSHNLSKLPFIVIRYVITVLPPLCFIKSSTVEQLPVFGSNILIYSVWSYLYFIYDFVFLMTIIMICVIVILIPFFWSIFF